MQRVLYVDDEPGLLEVGKLFLENTGEFTVDTALSAREALEVLKARPVDCIVSDYMMPEMNGIGFLKALRSEGNPVPFILFTGRGREEIVIEAINNGANFYLQKGGDPRAQFAELGHKIRQAIGRKEAELARSKAELALRESDNLLRLFIRHAPVALAMFDREMRYIAASSRWMADYHLGDRDLAGHSHYEIFPEIPEELKAIHRRSLAGETVAAVAEKFERQDGSVQWLSWEVLPWYNATGEIGGIIIFSEDVTLRKTAEEALVTSEEKYRRIIENLRDAYIQTDEYGTVTMVNPSAARMFGYGSPGEMAGLPVRSLFCLSTQLEDLLRKLQGGEVITGHSCEVCRKDGTTVSASLSAQFIRDREGQFRGYEGILREVPGKNA